MEQVEAWCDLEGVPSALAAARDAVDVRLRDRGLRPTTSELITESLLRGAAASAALDGSRSDLEELRRGSGDQIAIAAARVNAELLALVPVVARSPLQAIARLHTLAAAGSVPDDELGRPRAVEGIPDRLQGLASTLLTETSAPAIGVAAVAHAELATMAPFESGNGLVARALERLVLVARGVDPTSMVVPEAGHRALEAGYRTGLTAYAEDVSSGPRIWLLHAAAAVTRGVEGSPLG